jgi:hypothetical protein
MSNTVFRHHVGGIKLKLQAFLTSTVDGDDQSVSRPHHPHSGRAMGNLNGHKGKYLTAPFQKLNHCHLLRRQIVTMQTKSKYNSAMEFVFEFVKFGIHSIHSILQLI